jgi:Arc/MetJ-type ribon-helix-helix transcriptional regulator
MVRGAEGVLQETVAVVIPLGGLIQWLLQGIYMADLIISLPASIHAFVESRVAEGGFADSTEYVRALIEADQKFQEQETVRLREAAEAGVKQLDRGEYVQFGSSDQLLQDIVRRGEQRLSQIA